MDLNIINDYNDGFSVGFGVSPRAVSGNKLLANRFEITLLTNKKVYQTTGGLEYDSFGGNFYSLLASPKSVKTLDSISATLSVVIDDTVRSIQLSTPNNAPDTEKLAAAELTDVQILGDSVTASVRVVPLEFDAESDLIIDIPLLTRG